MAVPTTKLTNLPVQGPMLDENGNLTQQWRLFFQDLYNRAGGNVAASNAVLTAAVNAPAPAGPPGPSGPTGSTGPAGSTGSAGGVGPQGVATYLEAEQGEPGDSGPPGPVGPVGAQGIQGLQGFPGMSGDDGIDGDLGPPGPQGNQGIQGFTGAQGGQGVATFLEADQGESGDIGPPGPIGLIGAQGVQGITGIQGNTGSQGPMGVAIFMEADAGQDGDGGPPGVAGANGLTGSQGPMGPAVFMEADQGDEGMQGPPGPPYQLGPCFSVYPAAAQTLSTSVFTKIQCNTKNYDTNGSFDAVTNFRFQPNVAGYYRFSAAFYMTGAGGQHLTAIFKNGASVATAASILNALGDVPCISFALQMNGTTDFIEFYGYQGSGGSVNTIAARPDLNYFTGEFIRGL